MKVKIIKASAFLSMIFAITVFLITPVRANDFMVIGSNIGLEVTPHDQNLFNELNLNPGDYKESNITIKNTNNAPFELFLKAERLDQEPSSGNPDLFKQLIITVFLRGKEIYSGSMINFATGQSGIALGKFNPGETQQMKVLIHLPGVETGNEFMGLTHKNQWIFTATNNGLPKTGETFNYTFLIVTGLVLILLGVLALYKSKKTKNKLNV